MAKTDDQRRSGLFLLLYALAYAGGVMAYLPLLALFLPVKVEAMAGDARLGLLTVTTLVGALSASVSNILFGMLSDRAFARGGSRRGWVWLGLAAVLLSFIGVRHAATTTQIVIAIAAFQMAVNILLAPLFAMMADEIPDSQKGIAGGLLAVAAPVASIFGGLVAGSGLSEGGRLAAVGAAVAIGVVPLLLTASRPLASDGAAEASGAGLIRLRGLARIWASRLLVQTAASVPSTYLLFYFESIARGEPPIRLASMVGHLSGVALLLSVPLALVIGRLSDASGRRKPYLVATALCLAGGFLILAVASTWPVAVLGYVIYACSSAAFLSLHSAFAMQNLPSRRHRGRDLGILNLANTLPIFIGPVITWAIADVSDFRPVLLLVAILSVLAAVLILTLPRDLTTRRPAG